MLQIVIPSSVVWESNAAFATDFQIFLRRPIETASLQVAISSQDSLDNDVPLAIPHRIPVTWQPGDKIAGVQRIRDAWESSENHVRNDKNVHRTDLSLPIEGFETKSYFQRSAFARLSRERISKSPSDLRSSSPRTVYVGTPAPVQDKNWNVVASPTASESVQNSSSVLPLWANEASADFGEIVVV